MRPTKAYGGRAKDDPRFRILPHGTFVHEIADRARAAGFVFISSSRWGWGKRDLANWLVHDYRSAVLEASARPRSEVSSAKADEASATKLVASARRRVVEMLSEAATTWNGADFARESIDNGLVIGVSDDAGGLGFAPVHQSRMRLVDRLASLFIADYLTRPRDYEDLVVCSTCDEVSFKWDEIHEDGCEARGRRSGVVVRPRYRHSTDQGLGKT
jgi:hypothetical protein